ncbi:MAG: thioredoxin [Thiotrichaceae bacterium]|nr:thioredoxin [Thiotrichaceae bacterium]
MATVDITEETFEGIINDNDIVIVDFWAEWCGPCKSFSPTYEAVSEKHPDVVFGKVDTEAQQEISAHFQIRSIPTLMIFREQVVLFSQAGMLSEEQLNDVITKVREIDMKKVHEEMEKQAQEGKS